MPKILKRVGKIFKFITIMANQKWFYVSYEYGCNRYGTQVYMDATASDAEIESEVRRKANITGSGFKIISIQR